MAKKTLVKDSQGFGMKLMKMTKITIGDLVSDFKDTSEDIDGGVFAWDGRLTLRPKFQRGFVVDGKKAWQTELINSILNGRPIGLMYFGLEDGKYSSEDDIRKNGKFYCVDGQQRLITALSFRNGDLSLDYIDPSNGRTIEVNFENLPFEYQKAIDDYELDIVVCDGTEEEMLKWFETINQPTYILTEQELRNAAYNGEWCESAKRMFSLPKSSLKKFPTEDNGFILNEDSKYCFEDFSIDKKLERQDLLEMALDWASMQCYGIDTDKDDRIRRYMKEHRNDTDASDLKNRYMAVIDWARSVFYADTLNRKSTKKPNWGELYVRFKDTTYNLDEINRRAMDLFRDTEVTAYGKVFEYVLSDNPKDSMLVLRNFPNTTKEMMFAKQGGKDPIDGKEYKLSEMHAHHIKPWACGGKTEDDNCVLVSKTNHENWLHNTCRITEVDVRRKLNELMESVENGTRFTPYTEEHPELA